MSILEKRLICPACKIGLTRADRLSYKSFICPKCHKKYSKKENIPILISKIEKFKKEEKKLAEFEAKKYQIDKEKKWFPNFEVYKNILLPILNLPKNSKILELGSGVSYISPLILKRGLHLTLSDIAFSVLKRTKKYLKVYHLDKKASFFVLDAENIPFLDSTFSACFMISGFHHLPNQEKALKEMKRVTKNGGFIIFLAEPNSWPYKTIFPATAPLRFWLRKRTKRKYDSIADEKTKGFSKKEIISLFEKEGLKIESIVPTLFLTQFYGHFLIFLNRLFGMNLERKEKTENFLNKIDNFLAKIPILNNFFWHTSYIGKVKKND